MIIQFKQLPRKIKIKITIIVLMILSVLPMFYGLVRIKDIPPGLGFAAKDVCSRVFVSQDDPERVINNYTKPKTFPLFLIWKIDIDNENKIVTASDRLSIFSSQAVYRENLGCTTVVDDNLEELQTQSVQRDPVRPLPKDLEWPFGSSPKLAKNVKGVNYAKMQEALDNIFEKRAGKPYQTMSAVVAYKGHLVAEQYADAYTKDQLYIGWSMSKTITVLILGLLDKDGLIDINKPAPIKSWKGTGKEAITLRHIINMASGLEWFEGYGGLSNASELFYSNKDTAKYVRNLDQESEPGTSFVYSSGNTQLLAGIIKEKSGGTLQTVYDLYQKRLFEPIGIVEGFIEPDASGTFIGAGFAHLKPRDWMRLGQLVLNKGRWGDKQIVKEEWIDFLRSPSPANPGYGGQCWLYDEEMEKFGLPKDTFLFRGYLGQYMAVIPSKDLVYLRLGVGVGDVSTVLDRYYPKNRIKRTF